MGLPVESAKTSGHTALLALVALALGFFLLPQGALAGGPRPIGSLIQLSEKRGCVSDDGTDGDCTDGRALQGPGSVAVSPDGRYVYVASEESDAVLAFKRDAAGVLADFLCVSRIGRAQEYCILGRALDGAFSVAVSPDGENVYVASIESDAVAVFRVSPAGLLIQLGGTLGCVSDTTAEGCARGKGLRGPRSVTVSPDGQNVYVASVDSDAVAIFSRRTGSGHLGELVQGPGGGQAGDIACYSETGAGGCIPLFGLSGAYAVTVSPDGENAYVAARDSDAVVVFSRDAGDGDLIPPLGNKAGCVSDSGSGGRCSDGKALRGPRSVTVSPDGASVYVAAEESDAVAVFARGRIEGSLIQLDGRAGCVSATGGGGCANGRALSGARSVVVFPSVGFQQIVYVVSRDSDGIAVFGRDPVTGELTQFAGKYGCVSETGRGKCTNGRGLNGPFAIAVAVRTQQRPNPHVYVASFDSDAIAIFDIHQ